MYKKRFTFFFFAIGAQLIMAKSFGKTHELRKILKKNNKLKFRTISKLKGAVLYLDENNHVPKDWFQLDYEFDSLLGVSSNRAYQEFPQINFGKEIVVAVIDAGVDVNHEDLAGKIWTNHAEIPNNNIDDDNNGYIDDYMGWNFLGAKSGSATFQFTSSSQEVELIQGDLKLQQKEDSLEVTREFKRLKNRAQSSNKLSTRDNFSLENLERLITRKRDRAKKLYNEYNLDLMVFNKALDLLSVYDLDPNNILIKDLDKIKTENEIENQAIKTLIEFCKQGVDKSYLTEQKELYRVQYEVHYNPNSNLRDQIVKDDPNKIIEVGYGNNDVIGPDSLHGTHIAGIIAANHDNNIGTSGIAKNVKIMPIRAVPDGDERDKDIVNSIYYAVNNGAHIINLSFGKYLSPNQYEVKKALQYAKEKNVLVVQAAGNDYLDIDKKQSFPNPFINGKKLSNYITVSSSTPDSDETVISPFSNYGKNSIDILAPGSFVYSTVPNNKYASMSGTSMAAPVVSSVAAVLLSQAPQLKAEELKRLILKGKTDLNGISIFKPGLGRVNIEDIFKEPGVVNLHSSIKLLLLNSNLANN